MSETQPNRPSFPWQVRLAEALTVVLVAAGTRRDGTVRRRVLSLLDFHAPPNPVPVDGVATSDHVVDPARNLSVRIFAPREESPVPIVFYFHGGGFVFNSAFSYPYDAFCRRLARQVPARVVSVDYRLAPEHRFPAAYDDCFDAVAWLDDYILASAGDAPATSVFLAGESAGGNIAHHVARRMLASSSFRSLTSAGVVAVQPFFGGEEETQSERRLEGVPMGSRERYKWMWRSFLPEGSSLDHEAANVFGPGSGSGSGHGDWTGFPPTMVVVGGMDTLQDRQRWYCEGLRRAGVEVCVREYGDAIHAFQFFKNLPEAEQMVVDVADFVREAVGSG